ncbi:MAG: HAD-IA family hydrolase [Roseinatronobacter sp.]
MKHLVIFDVDGTLIDSQDHIVAAMTGAFGAVGLPLPPRAALLGIVGLSLPQAMAALVPDQPLETQLALVDAYKASFMGLSVTDHAQLYPGARAVLDRLAAGGSITLAVATGKSRRGLDRMVTALGLDGYFATMQVADDHPSKPNPSMILACLRDTGITAERAVMVGDTSFDRDMARAAGVGFIGVSWGYHATDTLGPRVIEHFGALPGALEQLWGLELA